MYNLRCLFESDCLYDIDKKIIYVSKVLPDYKYINQDIENFQNLQNKEYLAEPMPSMYIFLFLNFMSCFF